MVDLGYYFPYVVALGFVSSAAAVLVAVWRADDPRVRKSFLAVFFAGLLAVNLVPVPAALPFSNLHKYTGTSSNPTTYHDVYVVDAEGNELRYDGNAAPPAGTLIRFGRGIATEYDEPKARSTADHLLERGRAYRGRIEAGRGVGPHVDFPPHALGHSWTDESLSAYGEFVALRVYRVELHYTDSGLAVEERDQTLVATYTARDGLTRNGSAP
jgi:hypothetical protein